MTSPDSGTWEARSVGLKPALVAVGEVANRNGFFLAGGTGLGAMLSHRLSEDLDFFIQGSFDTKVIGAMLQDADPGGRQGMTDRDTLYWYAHGDRKLKVSFISAPGKKTLVQDRSVLGCTVGVASLLDIAAMKSVAMIGRMEKRDYVDLAAILLYGKVSLAEILAFNLEKFQSTAYQQETFLRCLTYFTDIDASPMPKMTSDLDWEMAKRILTQALHDLTG